MSPNNSATRRRFSLLAGSSLAITLASAAFTATTLAPTLALAANECGNPSANAAAADTVVCLPGIYATGIDYSTTTNGDLTVVLRDGVNTRTSIVVGNGPIRMYGKAGEDMSLRREDTPGVVGDPRIDNSTGGGRAIDLTTLGDGNIAINLTDGDPDAGEPITPQTTAMSPMRITGATDAIRAQAFGSGGVSLVIAATGTPNLPNNTSHRLAVISANGGSGVLALTTTGAINIDTSGAAISAIAVGIRAVSDSGNINIVAGQASGRDQGVLAQTGGAGTVNVTVTRAIGSVFGGTFQAGVDTVAASGATLITVTAGTVSGGATGAAIRSVSGSTLANAVNVQNTGGIVDGRVDFTGVTASGVTFDNTGSDLVAGIWRATGVSVFTAMNDTLTMGGTGVNTTSAATLNFGAGVDTFEVSGNLTINGLTLTNLENFGLSGSLYMGGTSNSTDAATNDVLVMHSGTFTGVDGGRVVLDVDFDAGSQAGCAAATVADCLDLRGASTAGVTFVSVNDLDPAVTLVTDFRTSSITIADVGGAGASAAGHFVIDPSGPGYVDDPLFGGVMAAPGLFGYTILYDPDTQRHDLIGVPRSEALEYVVLGSAAQSIWHMTSEAVTNRQGALRSGAEGAMWLRVSGEQMERDLQYGLGTAAGLIQIDHSYKLSAGTIVGGMDFLRGGGEGYDYALGGQIGYVGSTFDLENSPNSGKFTGGMGGVYASLWSGSLFLDSALNTNFLTLDYDSRGLGVTTTYLYSYGGKVSGGLRASLGSGGLFAEPHASLAVVQTTFEEISVEGGEIELRDAKSLRGAVGLRVGADVDGPNLNLSYFLAGRLWNEFEGASSGIVNTPGFDFGFADAFEGRFSEAEGGVEVSNPSGTVSGFLTAGVKTGDDFSTLNLSAGLRMAW